MSDLHPATTDQDLRTAVARLEQRVTDLSLAVDHQNMQLSHIIDLLGGIRNSTDWSAVQGGELLRVLFTGIQQIRDTQIGSLLSDGPITMAELQKLQAVSHEQAQALVAAKRTRAARAQKLA
jgi:bacterioferritin-associated ferredoxin